MLEIYIGKSCDYFNPTKERPSLPNGGKWNALISKCWAMEKSQRPAAVYVLEKLKLLKSNPQLTASQQMEIDPETIEKQITNSFGSSQSLPWSSFCAELERLCRASKEELEELIFFFEEGGVLKKEKWINFANWCSPLVANNTNTESSGLSIRDIVSSISIRCFFGFINSSDAQNILQNCQPNAYLFRFSKEEGSYALSVRLTSTITHWRIIANRKRGLVFIDDRPYKGLQDIINTHESSQSLLSFSGEECYLKFPLIRQRKSQDLITF